MKLEGNSNGGFVKLEGNLNNFIVAVGAYHSSVRVVSGEIGRKLE